MYIAKEQIKGQTHYYIRETYEEGGKLKSRTLFALGPDPARYIMYPGGNAYYIHESVELSILEKGYEVDTFELEDLFWPFLETRLKRIIKRPPVKVKRLYKGMSIDKLREIQSGIHIFDKRRLHYLRFGQVDQRRIAVTPYRFYNRLLGKSRDEIEAYIEEIEERLKPSEIKIYIYTIFNLQRYFFDNPYSLTAPFVLEQDRMDDYFMDELCRLNSDDTFFGDNGERKSLHRYLVKYLIMYFDSEFVRSPGTDWFSQFKDSNFYNPPCRESRISLQEACRRLNITEQQYRTMSKKEIVTRFKRLAHECHPDKGGGHEDFIALCEAYKRLLEAKRG